MEGTESMVEVAQNLNKKFKTTLNEFSSKILTATPVIKKVKLKGKKRNITLKTSV